VLDASRIEPRTLVYSATLRDGSLTRTFGERAVRVARTVYNGVPALQLLETYGTGPTAGADTMVVDAQTLRPLHWGSYAQGGLSKLLAEFRGDSIFGGISAPHGRRSIAGVFPPGTLHSAAMTETLLGLYPVDAGWRDSLTLSAIELGTTTVLRAEAAVLAEERIETLTGAYATWMVTVTTTEGEVTYWIDKAQRFVVRSSRLLPDRGNVLIYELTGISR
jgi:hypothetical protein